MKLFASVPVIVHLLMYVQDQPSKLLTAVYKNVQFGKLGPIGVIVQSHVATESHIGIDIVMAKTAIVLVSMTIIYATELEN